jgi:hypothetical protein
LIQPAAAGPVPSRQASGSLMQEKNSKHINGLYSFFDFDRFQGDLVRFEPDLEVVDESKMANSESESANCPSSKQWRAV